MDIKDKIPNNGSDDIEDSNLDSGIFTDDDSARQDFASLFSDRFSNIRLLYSSPRGATEIHIATRYGKLFVLKGLKSEYRNDPVVNMCLAKEFEIGITLDHPNIRRTIGMKNVRGLGKRIILEFVDGASLSEMLASGNLDAETARKIARQTAIALDYLHSRQIFHRDLKPENIMIPHQRGDVKLIDFNLSDRADYVILKNPAGTPGYMAPEQTSPDSISSPEADYYSLGVIMKGLAAASGDRLTGRAASLCMNQDPGLRRQGVDLIQKGRDNARSLKTLAENILDSKILTFILASICVLLSAFITVYYLKTTIL